MGYHISKFLDIGQSSILKSDDPYCFTHISACLSFYRNGFELEACLRMSPLKWDMSQPSKMFIGREIVHKLLKILLLGLLVLKLKQVL